MKLVQLIVAVDDTSDCLTSEVLSSNYLWGWQMSNKFEYDGHVIDIEVMDAELVEDADI